MSKTPESAYGLLRAEYAFLASACSNALWGDDRYRDMPRKEFLATVRRRLKPLLDKAESAHAAEK